MINTNKNYNFYIIFLLKKKLLELYIIKTAQIKLLLISIHKGIILNIYKFHFQLNK